MPRPDELYIPKEYSKLSEIEGIALIQGLEFCGGWKAFEMFIDGFYAEIDGRVSEIEKALKHDDIEFYTMKVHSLKTVSRVIGAEKMAEMAADLEQAGEDNNIKYISDNTEELLSLLKSYKVRLSGYIEEKRMAESAREPISQADLNDAYEALREVVPSLDYDAVEMILGELKKYRLPKEDQRKVDKMEELLRHLMWDDIEELL